MYDIWKSVEGDYYVIPEGSYVLADFQGKSACTRLWLHEHYDEDGAQVILDVTTLLGVANDMRGAYLLIQVYKRQEGAEKCEPSLSSPSEVYYPFAGLQPCTPNLATKTHPTTDTTAPTPDPNPDICGPTSSAPATQIGRGSTASGHES